MTRNRIIGSKKYNVFKDTWGILPVLPVTPHSHHWWLKCVPFYLVEPQISSILEAASWSCSHRKAKSLKVNCCSSAWPAGVSGLKRLDQVLDRLTGCLSVKAGKWLIYWNYLCITSHCKKQGCPSHLRPPHCPYPDRCFSVIALKPSLAFPPPSPLR